MTRKEMTNERAQSDVRINSAEQGGIGRSQIESLFKTHYTHMYHLALTLLFDEAESKDVVSDVFASLLSSKVVMRADNAKAFLLACVRHRCMNVLQHKQVHERFARLLTEDTDALEITLKTLPKTNIAVSNKVSNSSRLPMPYRGLRGTV